MIEGQDSKGTMKTVSKWLALFATVISVFLLLSCNSQTSEQETTPQEEETPVIIEEEPSEQQPSQMANETPLITIDELLQLIEDDADIVIVDVRSEENYQLSHIAGAILVPEYVIQAGEWDPPEGKDLVLY